MVYNGLTYKLEGGRVGKGVIQGERYRLNENTYIDVIYFDKVVWTYVIMNDFTAYKAKKCDPINFSLVDTDCDGIPDILRLTSAHVPCMHTTHLLSVSTAEVISYSYSSLHLQR